MNMNTKVLELFRCWGWWRLVMQFNSHSVRQQLLLTDYKTFAQIVPRRWYWSHQCIDITQIIMQPSTHPFIHSSIHPSIQPSKTTSLVKVNQGSMEAFFIFIWKLCHNRKGEETPSEGGHIVISCHGIHMWFGLSFTGVSSSLCEIWIRYYFVFFVVTIFPYTRSNFAHNSIQRGSQFSLSHFALLGLFSAR